MKNLARSVRNNLAKLHFLTSQNDLENFTYHNIIAQTKNAFFGTLQNKKHVFFDFRISKNLAKVPTKIQRKFNYFRQSYGSAAKQRIFLPTSNQRQHGEASRFFILTKSSDWKEQSHDWNGNMMGICANFSSKCWQWPNY